MRSTRSDRQRFRETHLRLREAIYLLRVSDLVMIRWVQEGRFKPVPGPDGQPWIRREDFTRLSDSPDLMDNIVAMLCGGADGTRTRNFRRDRPVL